MLKLIQNTKGQNTAEYALLIALVIAAILAMQQYAKNALQARVRDASRYMTTSGGGTTIGNTDQYMPDYEKEKYDIDKSSEETTVEGAGLSAKSESTNRVRKSGGFTNTDYTGQTGH